jgi:ABC-type nitrate/sulfonate/bicarbonate transport system substrate-binding protein
LGIAGNLLHRILLIASCLAVSGAAQAEPTTLRIGYGGAAEEQLWLLIAKPAMGKHAGKDYTIEATRFSGSDSRAQAFEAGAIDLAEGGANGVIFAAAEGVSTKIIASLARESTRGFSTAFYVKADSPIKTVADLKGKIVGINGFSTSGHLWLKGALEKVSLTDSDVTIARTSFPAMGESLIAGRIDCGEFPQPFAAVLEHDAKVRKLFDAKYGLPFDEELNVLVGKDEFLKKHAGTIRAFLADLHDATQFYLTEPREARQILIDAKMIRVNPEIYLSMVDWYRDPTMRPDLAALKKMQEFQVKAGFQKKPVDIDSIVDTSYLPK